MTYDTESIKFGLALPRTIAVQDVIARQTVTSRTPANRMSKTKPPPETLEGRLI